MARIEASSNSESLPQKIGGNVGESPFALGASTEDAPDGQRLHFSKPSGAPGKPWVQVSYALADLFFVCLNGVAVFLFRFAPGSAFGITRSPAHLFPADLPLNEYVAFLLLYATLIILCCQSQDLYQTLKAWTALDKTVSVGKAVLLATLLFTAFIYLSGAKEISRLWVGFSAVLNFVTLTSWRLWKRQVVMRRVAQGHGAQNVLIVGAGKMGRALARHLVENKQLGYVVKGFLDENHHADAQTLGNIEDLPRLALVHFVDDVFITIPSERELVKKVVLEARRLQLNVKVVPELYDGLGWRAPLKYVGDFPVLELHWEPIPAFGLFIKRVLDIVLSCVTLVVVFPLLAVVAVAIKLDSPGPVFYRSKRVGKKGRIFSCRKLRTMVDDADNQKEDLRHMNERNGPIFKISNDPRTTRLGRWLRKYSIDELPQLWNVFKGDMSLVGPRPHPLDDCDRYSLEHLRRLDVTPGLTGLWQVSARSDPSFETNMALDLEYIENWSLWLDSKILLQTIPAVLRGEGT